MHRQANISCDVAVIGGGPGGLSAAISAARAGAKVVLVERTSALGGAAASGLGILGYIDRGGKKVLGGIAQEYIDRLAERGGTRGHQRCPVHNSITAISPDQFKLVAAQMCREAGVEVIYNCELTDVRVEGGHIAQVEVYGKCTDIRIDAPLFVDGTGDGDLAFMAGVPFSVGQDGTGINQPSTLVFTVSGFDRARFFAWVEENPDQVGIKEDYAKGYDLPFFRTTPGHCLIGLGDVIQRARAAGDFDVPRNQFIYIDTARSELLAINTVRMINIDASDPFQLSNGLCEGYRQIDVLLRFMRKYMPGFEDTYLTQISPALGVRETRHFEAMSRVTKQDMLNYAVDENTVALCGYNVDIHSGVSDHIDLYLLDRAFGLPYGCMIPRTLDNLFLSGRTISVDSTVFAAARVMGPLMAMGEAAGVAAKLCLDAGVAPSALDVAALREKLVHQGALLENV